MNAAGYWLANLVAAGHGLLVASVICGSAAAVTGRLRFQPRLERIFYFLIAALIASDLILGECALTGLEKWLRTSFASGTAYHGSFIGHYFGFLPPGVHDYGGPALVAASILAFPFWRIRDRIVRGRAPAPAQVQQDSQ